MKTIFLSLGLMLIFLVNAYSQAGDKKITLEKKRYVQSGQKLNNKQLKSILETNPASQFEYHAFKQNMAVANVLAVAGSVLILSGTAINLSSSMKQSKDVNNGKLDGTYPSGVGLLLLGCIPALATIPFIIPAKKHLTKAIENYNSGLKANIQRPVQFDMMVNTNGVGFKMRF